MDDRQKQIEGAKFTQEFDTEQMKVISQLAECLELLYNKVQALPGDMSREARFEIMFQNSLSLLVNLIANSCAFYLGNPPSRDEFMMALAHVARKYDVMKPPAGNDSAPSH